MKEQHSKGFTLIELLVVVLIIAILAAITVPNFLEAQTRAKISRVRNDLRTVAMAMHAYRVDNNKDPLYCNNRTTMRNANYYARNRQLDSHTDQAYTFRVAYDENDKFATLTTPIAYISSYPADPLTKVKGLTFCYTQSDPAFGGKQSNWMIWSFGPDQDEEEHSVVLPSAVEWGRTGFTPPYDPKAKHNPKPGDILIYSPDEHSGYIDRTMYCPGRPNPSPALLDVTYDPTNGTGSNGDIYRFRE